MDEIGKIIEVAGLHQQEGRLELVDSERGENEVLVKRCLTRRSHLRIQVLVPFRDDNLWANHLEGVLHRVKGEMDLEMADQTNSEESYAESANRNV